MIGLRIGPDFGQTLVGAPAYFVADAMPKAPHDLDAQACIGLRLPISGGLYSWLFVRDGSKLARRYRGPASPGAALPDGATPRVYAG